MSEQITRLLRIMETLRDPQNGCAWDRAQNFSTIVPYTIEEAYEVADAIERSDMADLKEELGDLLFQVVFHAQMAAELAQFNFEDVSRTICDKMESRHPHIFGDETGTMGESRWENFKEQERTKKGAQSPMDGVAMSLPALLRAEKLQKRAARVGFDWPDVEGPKAKLLEEMEELEHATSDAHKGEEAGDFLFAAVNLVRAYGIAPENALRGANAKFERRFRAMEAMASGEFPSLSLDEQEALWQAVKANESAE